MADVNGSSMQVSSYYYSFSREPGNEDIRKVCKLQWGLVECILNLPEGVLTSMGWMLAHSQWTRTSTPLCRFLWSLGYYAVCVKTSWHLPVKQGRAVTMDYIEAYIQARREKCENFDANSTKINICGQALKSTLKALIKKFRKEL